jgi:hypothetical protein
MLAFAKELEVLKRFKEHGQSRLDPSGSILAATLTLMGLNVIMHPT